MSRAEFARLHRLARVERPLPDADSAASRKAAKAVGLWFTGHDFDVEASKITGTLSWNWRSSSAGREAERLNTISALRRLCGDIPVIRAQARKMVERLRAERAG